MISWQNCWLVADADYVCDVQCGPMYVVVQPTFLWRHRQVPTVKTILTSTPR